MKRILDAANEPSTTDYLLSSKRRRAPRKNGTRSAVAIFHNF